ncbi:sporulation protein [Leptotrichia sp. oral taxon 221]|uniref:sporulation protein n=1 Tax=Leptotrichia sp. oral taxon 221 TaxID=712362 RepID=UPI001B8B57D8|nr:sporulation protein [Leptotrichia sp. oral taxon 221]QUB97497.1 sporulation protein [Leptotrichia sp. oral taxon 221]
MSFRINPFKILRIVGIIGVITYAGVEYSNYKSRVVKETSEITKDIKIRRKDFYMTQDYKNNLTVPQQTVDQTNKDVAQVITSKDSDTKKVDLVNNGQKKDDSTEQVKNNSEQANEEAKKQEEAKKNEEAKKQEEARKKEQQELETKREKQEAQRKAEAAATKAAAEKKAQQQAEAAKIAAAKKAQQEAAAKAKAEAAKKAAAAKKGPKKYLQVASLASESTAKATVRKLGGNFRYQKSSVNGRTVYVVMSAMTDNPSTLSAMERQVKSRIGAGYIVRTIGK